MASEGPPNYQSPTPKLCGTDYLLAIGLAALTFGLNIIGLGALEYFRHTEADRTLIAWEMFENGDYLTPHLIHSVILTKPPLYYWTLAGAMYLFGGVSEWIARFPSVFFSALFAILQYIVARKAIGSREFAVMSTLVLVTCVTFFLQSTVAEIDLLYGVLSAATFSIGYFAIIRASPTLLLWSYAVAGIAFLAKGPPVLFFYAVGQTLFFLAAWGLQRRGDNVKTFTLLGFVFWNLAGVLVFAAVVSSWLSAIAAQVGWSELWIQFKVEVLERVVVETHNPRGPFYYVLTFLGGLAPWSPLFLAGFVAIGISIRRGIMIPEIDLPQTRLFTAFNTIYFFSAFLMLSVAEGKSIRYLFPVYFAAAHLTAIFLPIVARSKIMPWFYTLAAGIAGLAAGTFLVGSMFLRPPGVTAQAVMTAALLLAAPFALLSYFASKKQGRGAIASLVLCMFGVRFALWLIYAPFRNETMTVKPIVEKIDQDLPPGAVLYNIELFERWVTYYLKHRGRETYRLSPEEAAHPRSLNGRAYLLLHHDEEAWRVEELQEVDPSVKIIEEFKQPKSHFLLVEADANALSHLAVRDYFPTKPSPPFFNEPDKAARTPRPPEHESE